MSDNISVIPIFETEYIKKVIEKTALGARGLDFKPAVRDTRELRIALLKSNSIVVFACASRNNMKDIRELSKFLGERSIASIAACEDSSINNELMRSGYIAVINYKVSDDATQQRMVMSQISTKVHDAMRIQDVLAKRGSAASSTQKVFARTPSPQKPKPKEEPAKGATAFGRTTTIPDKKPPEQSSDIQKRLANLREKLGIKPEDTRSSFSRSAENKAESRFPSTSASVNTTASRPSGFGTSTQNTKVSFADTFGRRDLSRNTFENKPAFVSNNTPILDIFSANNAVVDKIVAIGSSTGGTEAIIEILKKLPADIPPILIVQHMPQGFTKMFADRCNYFCKMQVQEASEGMLVKNGNAYIAPGGQHMRIHRGSSGYYLTCRAGSKVNGVCPSVDVFFDSLVDIMPKKTVGVILTGMGADGASGLLKLKRKGAYTIGQDEKTSVVYGMPKEAYDIGAVTKQAPIEDIAGLIMDSIF